MISAAVEKIYERVELYSMHKHFQHFTFWMCNYTVDCSKLKQITNEDDLSLLIFSLISVQLLS